MFVALLLGSKLLRLGNPLELTIFLFHSVSVDLQQVEVISDHGA